MPAYVIVDTAVKEPESYEEYKALARRSRQAQVSWVVWFKAFCT